MKITDKMLYAHAAEARDIWLKDIPSDEEIPVHEFSNAFEQAMEELVRTTKKQKKSYRGLQRVAAMFAAVLIGSGAFFTVNAEARHIFVGWIKELTDDYLIYRYEEDPIPSGEPLVYRPTWIPEGYSEFFVDEDDDTKLVAYSNEAGEIIKLSYIHNPDETDWFISTENTVKESTTINGNKADMLISTDPDTAGGILWSDENNCAFMLTGFLEVDDLIKMAESIQVMDPDQLDKPPVEPITDVHYEVTTVPDGYIEVLSDRDSNGGSQVFENEAGEYLTFLYTLNSGASSVYVEATVTTQYQTLFNGYEVDVLISENPDISSSITWIDEDNTMFLISGFLDADAMFAVAESIEHVAVDELSPSLGSLRYEPTYIPEGYSKHRETDTGNVRMIVFKDEGTRLLRYTYVYEPYSTNSYVVAEGAAHSVIEINGYQADMLLFEDLSSASCIMWTDENDCVHSVHAFLEEEELIKLAESVKLID